MIQKISSIRVTFITLIIMLLLLGTGIILSFIPQYEKSIKLMNKAIIYIWLKNNWQDNLVLTSWFLSITITAGILFINTFFCTITKQLLSAVKIPNLRRWSFFILHFLFLIVLACHGITMIAGHKNSNIILHKGDSYLFNNRYKIVVSEIKFSDDRKFLQMDPKKSRQLMTRKKFHIKKNLARIAIFQKKKKLVEKKVSMLHPLSYRSLRVTITKFVSKEMDGKPRIGVNLTISKDFFTKFFFTVYALMIITLACFTAVTWNPKKK